MKVLNHRDVPFRDCLLREADEGLMLETSASETVYGGQFTLSNEFREHRMFIKYRTKQCQGFLICVINN